MQPPMWIVLGMSIGVLLSWNGAAEADSTNPRSALGAVVRIAEQLVETSAAAHAAGDATPLSTAETRELRHLTQQLRAAATNDHNGQWIAAQHLEAWLQRISVAEVSSAAAPAAFNRTMKSATWQVTIGRGHIRTVSDSIPGNTGAIKAKSRQLLLSLRRAVSTLAAELQERLLSQPTLVTISVTATRAESPARIAADRHDFPTPVVSPACRRVASGSDSANLPN